MLYLFFDASRLDTAVAFVHIRTHTNITYANLTHTTRTQLELQLYTQI